MHCMSHSYWTEYVNDWVFVLKGGPLCFQFVSAAAISNLIYSSKSLVLNLLYLKHRKYRSQEMCRMTFQWRCPKVTAVVLIKKMCVCLHDKMRTTPAVTTELVTYTLLVMILTWLNSGGILLENYLAILYSTYRMCFSINHSLEIVDPIDVKL